MGTLRLPKLSDAAIVTLYRAGMSRYDIGLRAALHDDEIVHVLRRNGVPLRCDAEWKRLAAESRKRFKSTERMTARLRRPAC